MNVSVDDCNPLLFPATQLQIRHIPREIGLGSCSVGTRSGRGRVPSQTCSFLGCLLGVALLRLALQGSFFGETLLRLALQGSFFGETLLRLALQGSFFGETLLRLAPQGSLCSNMGGFEELLKLQRTSRHCTYCVWYTVENMENRRIRHTTAF